MKFSLSSSYFAGRRYTPDVMVAQTVALGFDAVELGYFTREVELDAWQMALAREGVSVSSIHAFCPMPLEMPPQTVHHPAGIPGSPSNNFPYGI